MNEQFQVSCAPPVDMSGISCSYSLSVLWFTPVCLVNTFPSFPDFFLNLTSILSWRSESSFDSVADALFQRDFTPTPAGFQNQVRRLSAAHSVLAICIENSSLGTLMTRVTLFTSRSFLLHRHFHLKDRFHSNP